MYTNLKLNQFVRWEICFQLIAKMLIYSIFYLNEKRQISIQLRTLKIDFLAVTTSEYFFLCLHCLKSRTKSMRPSNKKKKLQEDTKVTKQLSKLGFFIMFIIYFCYHFKINFDRVDHSDVEKRSWVEEREVTW